MRSWQRLKVDSGCAAAGVAAQLSLRERAGPQSNGESTPCLTVDFEAGGSWWERLAAAGFDASRPAVVVSTGVTLYLTTDAIAATLRQIAALAAGSTLAMTRSTAHCTRSA
jgi:O-methyltransferase involved in polyketide biosynthesis